MKPWAESFYKSEAWKKCRVGFLASRLWICERCGEPAVIAHHRIPLDSHNIREADVALGWDNLEALCQRCHNEEHHRTERERRYMFDENGNVKPAKPYPPSREAGGIVGDRGKEIHFTPQIAHNFFGKEGRRGEKNKDLA